MQPLLAFYRSGRQEGSFDLGIERALQLILASPKFVFRAERDPAELKPGSVHRVSDVELASRLSFFLWSSIPDDELLAEANAGRLKDPSVLERQTRRMLADPKAQALVSNFAGQWLHLRNLRNAQPHADDFPDFDDNLRHAFQRETELLFESVMREDRSVVDLLRADYTFVNERLARHYGIPNVYGSQFRRVPVTDEARKGLLGHGSILTLTSHATRTSPVVRGKFILENILGTPPPSPPPDVPYAQRKRKGAEAKDGAGTDGGASRQSDLRQLSQDHGPDRFRAGQLRRRRSLAHRGRWCTDRRVGRAHGRDPDRRSGLAAQGHSCAS